MPGMDIDRLEAIGPRGEACVILRTVRKLPNGQTETSHTLATGERMKPGDVPGQFVTLNGGRIYTLRN